MAPQGFVNAVGGVHNGQPFENNEAPVAGTISAETAGFLVVLVGVVVAFMAAF